MKFMVIPIIKPYIEYNYDTKQISFINECNWDFAIKNFTENETTIFHYLWNDYQIIESNGVAVAPIYKSIKIGNISDGDEIIIVCLKSLHNYETLVKYCKLHYSDNKHVTFKWLNENGTEVL